MINLKHKDYNDSMDKLLENIDMDYNNWSNGAKFYRTIDMSIESGRKFDKVVRDGSVWGFVAKKDGVHKGIPFNVGDVFKPAGWRAPAKHVRGSIFSDSIDWFTWTGPNYIIR